MTSERSQSKSGAQISPELMDSCPVGWELHTCCLTNSRQTQETRSSAQPSHVLSGDLDYSPVSGPQFPHL